VDDRPVSPAAPGEGDPAVPVTGDRDDAPGSEDEPPAAPDDAAPGADAPVPGEDGPDAAEPEPPADGADAPDPVPDGDGNAAPTPAPAAAAPRRAPRPHRTWGQRLLITANSLLAVLCLSSAWALGYYQHQIASIPRFRLSGVLDRQDDTGQPVNFLLVGSDSTGNPDPKAAENTDRVGLFHADSISILRVDPAARQARLLSLPRDLWVTIPGVRGKQKINAALAFAPQSGKPKPDLLIETIQQNFHLKVNHYVQVDFAAFRSIVDILGGVNLWFDVPAFDDETGLYMPEAGCRQVDGQMALNYARSRHYQARQPDGRYAEDPTSDIGRIARQQYFLKQAAKKAIARGARNPLELNNLIGVARNYVTIDDALAPQGVLDVVSRLGSFNPDDLPVVQPYTERQVFPGPGGDGLRLLDEPSRPIFDRFRDVDPAVNPEAAVRLTVHNGSGRGGLQASAVEDRLRGEGFVVVDTGDGPHVDHTIVRFAPGDEHRAEAVLVARYLDGTVAELREDPALSGAAATVDLIVGRDVTGVRTDPRPAEDITAGPGPSSTGPGVTAAPPPPATTTTRPAPEFSSFLPHPEGAC
jgi:LCP family protein required for cell wall assembly